MVSIFSSPDSQGDSAAVVQAIFEQADTVDVGILGEPDIVNRGGELTPDPRVVVPLRNSAANGPVPADLEFDLPDGPGDVHAEFYGLLDLYGIENIADMAELDGKAVPLENASGVVVPNFDEVATDEEDEEDDE